MDVHQAIVQQAPAFSTFNIFHESEDNLQPKADFNDIWRSLKATLQSEITESYVEQQIIRLTIVGGDGHTIVCDGSAEQNFFECLNSVNDLIESQSNFSIGLIVNKKYVFQSQPASLRPKNFIRDSIYSFDDWVGSDVAFKEEKISLNVADGVLGHLTYNGTSVIWDVGYRGIGGTPAMERATFQYDIDIKDGNVSVEFSPVAVINYSEAEPMDEPKSETLQEELTTKNLKKVLKIHGLKVGKALFSLGIVIDYFQSGFNNTSNI